MDDFPMAISGLALRTLHLIVDNFLWSVLWVFLSGVLAHVAGTRGRSRTGWFFLSLLVLSPFISLIILLALPNFRRERIEAERHQEILQALANTNIDASAPATEFSSPVSSRGLTPERFHKAIETIGLTKESAHIVFGRRQSRDQSLVVGARCYPAFGRTVARTDDRSRLDGGTGREDHAHRRQVIDCCAGIRTDQILQTLP